MLLVGFASLVVAAVLLLVIVILLVSDPLSIPLFVGVLVLVGWLVARSERRRAR